MILVRVAPSGRQATLLSIPRALWVPIPDQGEGKISTAYQLGGAPAAIAAVESNFKVHIDDYAWIGLNGPVKLIDRLRAGKIGRSDPVLAKFFPSSPHAPHYTEPYYRARLVP